LDNHSVFNVAFALTEFRSPAFYDAVREIREIAYRRILDLPPAVPVVLTNWYSQGSAWATRTGIAPLRSPRSARAT